METPSASLLPLGEDRKAAVFLGELSPAALAKKLAQAAIYAAPARYEPFGLGILEAALAGCALVLSDLPSLRENWSGAALFLPPGDQAAWREVLNGLARDEAQRADLGHAGADAGGPVYSGGDGVRLSRGVWRTPGPPP